MGDFLMFLYLHKSASLGYLCSFGNTSPNNCQAMHSGRSKEHALTWKHVIKDETDPSGSSTCPSVGSPCRPEARGEHGGPRPQAVMTGSAPPCNHGYGPFMLASSYYEMQQQ